MPKKAEPEEQPTFESIIEAIDSVEVDPERHLSIQIDTSLRDAIRAAQSSGQPASVTVTVKVKPSAERRVSFIANVSAKLPRPPVSAVTLYADADGNVHRSDPAQLPMAFPAPTPISRKTEV